MERENSILRQLSAFQAFQKENREQSFLFVAVCIISLECCLALRVILIFIQIQKCSILSKTKKVVSHAYFEEFISVKDDLYRVTQVNVKVNLCVGILQQK